MDRPLLVMEHLSLVYSNGHPAVTDVHLELGRAVVGLLGPNGAGKSSLMAVLATLFKPSSGRVSWRGTDTAVDPNALRAELGYLPQHFGIYPALSASEFLHYIAAAKGLPRGRAQRRVEECLEVVGLSDAGDRRLGGFSGGMKQRVGIAQALLNDPRLLIIDEPTVGLDPEERLRFRLLLDELAVDRLIILSTHIVADIESSASSIVIIEGGRVRFHGSAEELLQRAFGRVWEVTIPSKKLDEYRRSHVVSTTTRDANGVRLRIVGNEHPGDGAYHCSPTLEDAYLSVLKTAE